MRDMLHRMMTVLRRDDRGAGLVEYALLLALIAIACIGSLQFFGSGTGGNLTNSSECIAAANSGGDLPDHC